MDIVVVTFGCVWADRHRQLTDLCLSHNVVENHLPYELPLKTLELRNRTLATITATAAQTTSMSQPSATTSTATTMTEQQSQRTPATPDVEDWLDSYDRVSVYNRWDNSTKLANVVFYLTDVAETWFLNHEEEILNWDAFTTKLKDIFDTPTSRKENAKKTLETRRQGEETYTSYIEDVLALCRRVNCEMQEIERLREPKATNSELRTLIRDIVREELRQMFNETHRGAEPRAMASLQQLHIPPSLAAFTPATLTPTYQSWRPPNRP
ncbi:hypothetical protein HPB47_012989, partial [Ixodes persulcatus]